MMMIFFLPTDYRWYITDNNETENVAGAIKSVPSGGIIYPELQWEEYLAVNITECNTTDSTYW